MPIKKSALYRSLWKSCDELRGGMDASQYKDYVLTLLFVKYVSDKYAGVSDAVIEIPEGGSFADLSKLRGNKEIGEKINIVIDILAKANDLRGVIDIADFNDDDKLGKGKEMQDRLSQLIAIFSDLDFSGNRSDGDDLLGDAYEYLMRHFATESGKSKGQFYTPAEVSRVIAKIIGINKNTTTSHTVYDPTCGSGSLLLKANEESPQGMTIYGQEKDVATKALALMNMYLHDNPTAVIKAGDTLSAPLFKDKEDGQNLKQFDFIVANPPFSMKSWSHGFNPQHDEFNRFQFGVPPTKNGDYAFLLHMIHSLKSTGKCAVILPHGVLFRGNAEAAIRQTIIQRGYIKGIIGLPANLFYGTGIPACILVLDKEDAAARKGIFMIDASKGFIKDGNKNRLRAQDIHKIVDVFNKGQELEGYSRMVAQAEIADSKNGYNLNLPRYIDSSDDSDEHDLTAHLKGGIPQTDIDALQPYWRVLKTTRKELFKPHRNPAYVSLKMPSAHIKASVLQSREYQRYTRKAKNTLAQWQGENEAALLRLGGNSKPKAIIQTLSESLLAAFTPTPLLDEYDIYQHLMDYWAETMQDDIYQIVAEGWRGAAQIRPITEDANTALKETADIIIGKGKNAKKYKADLIPPSLLTARYYPDEQRAIEELQVQQEAAAQQCEAWLEEHSGGESELPEVKNDKGKVTQANLKSCIKAAKDDAAKKDELALLVDLERLLIQESALAAELHTKQAALDKKLLAHYNELSVEAIKELVVQDKWFARLHSDVATQAERVVQSLVARVQELEARYAQPLPTLSQQVADYTSKVEAHLNKMGLS